MKKTLIVSFLVLALYKPAESQEATWGRIDYINKGQYGFRVAMDAPWKFLEFAPFTTAFVKSRNDGAFRASLNSVFILPFILSMISTDTSSLSLEEFVAVMLVVPQAIANSRVKVPFGTQSLFLSVGFNTDVYELERFEVYSEFFMGVQWRFSRVAFQVNQTIPVFKVPFLDKGLSISGSVCFYLFS